MSSTESDSWYHWQFMWHAKYNNNSTFYLYLDSELNGTSYITDMWDTYNMGGEL